MNDEAPDMISINPAVAARHPFSDKRIGDVLYRRVDPPAAVNPLTEDRCMFCGGKTAHEPDCDHGRPTPAPSDERDKALAQAIAALHVGNERLRAECAKQVISALATVRAEGMEAQFKADAQELVRMACLCGPEESAVFRKAERAIRAEFESARGKVKE